MKPDFRRKAVPEALLLLAVGAVISAALAGSVQSQIVERNPPPVTTPAIQTLPSTEEPVANDDTKPLGMVLRSLVLLGPTSAPVSTTSFGNVLTGDLRDINAKGLNHALKPFLGHSLSRHLVSQVEVAIVREYRRQGRPFVEVSTPEQELTYGVLLVRVVQFRMGTHTVKGASRDESRRIKSALRLEPGQPIDANRLEQDLNWLDRYPFRSLSPALSPGAAPGETDLTFVATHQRPWRVFVGYSNSGTEGTDYNRNFMGVEAGGLFNTDSLFAAQITGSPDFWVKDGWLFGEAHPAYESAAGRFTLPVAPRQEIEVSLDAVQTRERVQAFDVRQLTLEANLGYRGALSNLIALPGDALFGLEAKRQTRRTFFGDVDVLDGAVDVVQLYVGWSEIWRDRFGHSSLDVTAHVSPGGLSQGNTDRNFALYTNKRVINATYAYVDLDYSRETGLPAGLALTSELIGQVANRSVPDSEQFAIGGPSLVRGYTLDDGAFDEGLVLRNTFRLPLTNSWRARYLSISPYVFADGGLGRNEAVKHVAYAAAVGFGADIQLRAAVASVFVSCPLIGAVSTRAEAVRLQARVTVAY